MRTVKVSLTKDLEGIKILEDIYSDKNVLLLRKLNKLTLNNIEALKNYNITEVDISVKDYEKITNK